MTSFEACKLVEQLKKENVMKNEELKTLWKLAKLFWISGFIFWIIETIVFLIIEGWHWKAKNPIEIYCDKTVSNMWLFALNVTVFICVYLLINLNRECMHHNIK
jgi:hypothetical protein